MIRGRTAILSSKSIISVAALAAVASITPHAQAQWTVTNLHPAGATVSEAYSAAGSQQVGTAGVGGIYRACRWSGTAESWVDMHAAGWDGSVARSGHGTQQAGHVWDVASGAQHASLWSGTAASWVDLHPAGATLSVAWGTSGSRQVGYAELDGTGRASLWSGTAASWVDLTPAGATSSSAIDDNGVEQVGNAVVGGVRRASLWRGTAASWVDLHPAGATSSALLAASGSQQAGYVLVGGIDHAALWSGTAASWVDLHPAGATESRVTDISGALQVGSVKVGGLRRASLWSGTAASWVDLHAFLPAEFSYSFANGISSDGLTLYIAGSGFNTLTNGLQALLWTQPIPPGWALIDNLAEPVRAATPISTGAVNLWAAQSFRTDARSYELVSIDTKVGNLTGGAVIAELRTGDDPTGPLVTTLTAGPVPGVGLGEVTLTPDTPTVLNGLTRYFVVVYGPEGTAFDWAYADGNNYVGPGFFDTYWYTSDRGVTWTDFGAENPYFLRVNVGVTCSEDQRTDSSCVFLTDTGGDPQIDVRRGACDAPQSGAPVDVITGDLRGLTEAGGVVQLTRSTCVADDAPFDRVTVTNFVSTGCNPAVYILARRGLSEQSDWGTASSGALRLGGEGACP